MYTIKTGFWSMYEDFEFEKLVPVPELNLIIMSCWVIACKSEEYKMHLTTQQCKVVGEEYECYNKLLQVA